MSNPQLGNLPSGFKCAQCQIDLPAAMSMVGHKTPRIEKSSIIICSACSCINVLGDSSLHPMTQAEFKSLPEASQRAVMVARAGVINQLNNGQSWSPHTQN